MASAFTVVWGFNKSFFFKFLQDFSYCYLLTQLRDLLASIIITRINNACKLLGGELYAFLCVHKRVKLILCKG